MRGAVVEPFQAGEDECIAVKVMTSRVIRR